MCQGLAPIAANQYLTSFLRTVENVMVPSCLAVAAASREVGLAQYGALRGMAMPVVFFPFSFLATLSTLLMPEITRAAERGERKTLQRLVQRTLLVTVVLSVPAGGLFCLFSGEIGMLLYQSGEIGLYLRVLGPLMPLMYLESMVDGILKGLGEQLATFRYAVLDSAFRLVAVAALVPRWGMPGFLFIMVCSNLLTSLLNLRRHAGGDGRALELARLGAAARGRHGLCRFVRRAGGARRARGAFRHGVAFLRRGGVRPCVFSGAVCAGQRRRARGARGPARAGKNRGRARLTQDKRTRICYNKPGCLRRVDARKHCL